MPEETIAEFFARIFARRRALDAILASASTSSPTFDTPAMAIMPEESTSEFFTRIFARRRALAAILDSASTSNPTFDTPTSDGSTTDTPEATLDAPPQDPIVTSRCTSPSCPVPTSIPHNRGLYLHNGEPNPFLLGQSNPPPEVWRMYDRVFAGTEQPGDQETIRAFARNHQSLLAPFSD